MNHGMSRRDFMRNTALFSALGVAPQFLTRTVEGATANPIAGFKDDRVLVVVAQHAFRRVVQIIELTVTHREEEQDREHETQ